MRKQRQHIAHLPRTLAYQHALVNHLEKSPRVAASSRLRRVNASANAFYTAKTHCRHSLSNGNWGDDFPPIDLIHLIIPCPDMLCLDPHSLGLDARGCLTARYTSVIEEQGDGGLGASERTRSHDWMVLSS